MKGKLLYYYYWENGKPYMYDIHPYRGRTNTPGFRGISYSDMLALYSKLTGKDMMHSTGSEMDNYHG